MTAPALRHLTAETGHERLSPLSEVEADVLEQVRPVLQEAIKHGDRRHVGAGWWIEAELEAGRLAYRLYGAPDGPELAACTLTRGAGRVPPLLEVSIRGMLRAQLDGLVTVEQAGMAGDLERCVAWAWLAGQ